MTLTKEQIEALREADTAMLDPSDDFEEPRLLEINAIYDLALRGLEAASSRNDALEEAAKVCDSYSSTKWHEYKVGHGPGRANPQWQGESDGASDCAAAIRALKQTA